MFGPGGVTGAGALSAVDQVSQEGDTDLQPQRGVDNTKALPPECAGAAFEAEFEIDGFRPEE